MCAAIVLTFIVASRNLIHYTKYSLLCFFAQICLHRLKFELVKIFTRYEVRRRKIVARNSMSSWLLSLYTYRCFCVSRYQAAETLWVRKTELVRFFYRRVLKLPIFLFVNAAYIIKFFLKFKIKVYTVLHLRTF